MLFAEAKSYIVVVKSLCEHNHPTKVLARVVDRVIVYNDDRLVYSLKDGSEITVML